MPYRFIRSGNNPVNQWCRENELVSCFAYCTDKIKGRLQIFIEAKKAMQITFRFIDHTVRVKRL